MLSCKYEFKAVYENDDGNYVIEAMNKEQAHYLAISNAKTRLVRLEDWQENAVWTLEDGFVE